ncbi:hypothetical protein NMG60_11012637 [Bertholletia excelsa]
MAGARICVAVNGGSLREKLSGRPMPRRGQVKAGMVLGLAHFLASFFSNKKGYGGSQL